MKDLKAPLVDIAWALRPAIFISTDLLGLLFYKTVLRACSVVHSVKM